MAKFSHFCSTSVSHKLFPQALTSVKIGWQNSIQVVPITSHSAAPPRATTCEQLHFVVFSVLGCRVTVRRRRRRRPKKRPNPKPLRRQSGRRRMRRRRRGAPSRPTIRQWKSSMFRYKAVLEILFQPLILVWAQITKNAKPD